MKNSFLKTILKDTRGATVFIAMGIAFILMVVAIGIAIQTQDTQRNIKAFDNSFRAKNIADSLMGMVARIGGEHEAGFSLDENQCAEAIKGRYPTQYDRYAAEGATFECQIKGRNDKPIVSPELGEVYTVPAVNTGDASNNCQPLRPIRTAEDLRNFGITEISDPLDHPCNWGRLNFGNSITSRVAIPLYYDEVTGIGTDGTIQSEVRKLDDLTDLRIRVRTPCKPFDVIVPGPNGDETEREYPEICDHDIVSGGNYQFGVSPLDNIDVNKTVVMWQISATCEVGGQKNSCGLTPDTSFDERKRRKSANSEIHGYLIDADGYIDLSNLGKAFGFSDKNPTIVQFLSSDIVKNPTLQLAIITRGMKDRLGDSIPNLEYQILGDGDHPLSNAAKIYEVTVTYQGQMYKATKSIATKKNVVDFAIQN